MNDPVVEAANKAWNGSGVYRTIAENAAREALSPIRAWYVRQTQMWYEGVGGISPMALEELVSMIFETEE